MGIKEIRRILKIEAIDKISRYYSGLSLSDSRSGIEEGVAAYACYRASGGLKVLPYPAYLNNLYKIVYEMAMLKNKKSNRVFLNHIKAVGLVDLVYIYEDSLVLTINGKEHRLKISDNKNAVQELAVKLIEIMVTEYFGKRAYNHIKNCVNKYFSA